MEDKDRIELSDAFLADLKRIMKRHRITSIRVFDNQMCGFHKDGAWVFQCERLEYHGNEMPRHDAANTNWTAVTTNWRSVTETAQSNESD